MATPIEEITAAIQQAISNALQENASIFQQAAGPNPSNDQFAPGFDPLSLLTNLLADAAIAAILGSIGGPLPALLTDAVDGGGKSFVEFILEFALGWIIPQLLQPFILDAQNQVNTIAKPGRFDVNQAADLSNKGFYDTAAAAQDALETGFNDAHFAAAQLGALNWPGWQVINQLRNRGYIGDADVAALYEHAGIPPGYQVALQELRKEILTPADWALAALRGAVTEADAQAGAALWGVSADDFQTLMLNTGEPPGLMQLLEAYRRGFIDQPTLELGIRQSRVRDQWIPTIEALRYVPMSTADAANAVVRGYLAETQGADIAQQNGLEPAHWQYVLESNGRPPSHEQLATLYLRGIITQAEFEQGIRESDIKDKYITDVFDLRVKFLPLFEARTLLNAGEISGATFSEQLLVQGYQKEVIDEILAAAGTGKKVTAKHLTVTDYVDLYSDGIKNRADTITGLESIGYNATDAASILDIADAKATNAIVKQQITNVRTQFNRYKLTQAEATTELETIGLAPAQVTQLVTAWDVTRPQGTRSLTEAQILKAAKDGAITKDDAHNRLRGLGLDDADATLLVLISG